MTEPLEIEVKLRMVSAGEARRRIESAGGRVIRDRHFEDNRIFDNPQRTLSARGALLRVRSTTDGGGRLTYKEKLGEGEEPAGFRAKVRREWEAEAQPPETAAQILAMTGFQVIYRYQKYRTVFRLEECAVELDETPIGCFVEIEGPRARILRVAELLGVTVEEFITEDYRSLHLAWLEERGLPPGDMVFKEGGPPGRRPA